MSDKIDRGNDKHGAAVKFPPPLIFLAWMLAAATVDHFAPWPLSDTPWLRYLGGLNVLAGLTIILLVNRSFKRVATNIKPWKPTTSIVSTGLFACSRNPVYTAFCVITIGTGLWLNSLWVLCSFVPAAVMVYFVAIRKEEAYLEGKFGEEYLAYKKKVRRWL